MKCLFTLCVLLMVLVVEPVKAADETLSQDAINAANKAVKTVDGWVKQAQSVENKLKEVKGQVDKVEKTQKLLQEALSQGSTIKLREAVKKWKPEWAGQLEKLEDVQLLVMRLNPRMGPKMKKIDDALLYLGQRGADLNGRVLGAWKSTGLSDRIDAALKGKGPLGMAVRYGQELKRLWGPIKKTKDDYDNLLKQMDQYFKPQSQTAFSGVESIHRILNHFKDQAPPPIDKILGGYADVLGGMISALKGLDVQISQNSRQMNLMRSLDATKDGILEALKARFPHEDPYSLTEIKTPSFLSGGRFFVKDSGTYYYFKNNHMYRFQGSFNDLQTITRWYKLVYGKRSLGSIETGLTNFRKRLSKIKERFDPAFETYRARMDTLYEYLKRYYKAEPKTIEDARKVVFQIKSWDYEEALAHFYFNSQERFDMEFYAGIFTNNVLVDVTVTGSGDAFKREFLNVWAKPNNYSMKTLQSQTEKFESLVTVDHLSTKTVLFGASHGKFFRETVKSLPRLPGRIDVSLHIKVEQEEEKDPETPEEDKQPETEPTSGQTQDSDDKDEEDGLSDEDLDGLGEDNDKGEEDSGEDEDKGDTQEGEADDGVPEVEGDDEKPTGEDVEPLDHGDVVDLEGGAEGDTSESKQPHETNDEYGSREPNLNDPKFDEFFDHLLEGKRDEAKDEFIRLTGADDAQAEEAMDELFGEQKDTDGFNNNNAALDGPYQGERPRSDDDHIKDEGIDSRVAGGDVRATESPSNITDRDTRDPQGRRGDPGFAAQRQRDRQGITNMVTNQRRSANQEWDRAQQDVKNTPLPTRGGMQGIDVGQAQKVTISVWDTAAEDGDRVRISIGGRTIARDVTLLNKPQSFTVNLTGEYTSVAVIALNLGTSPPNTAAFAIYIDGKKVKQTGWQVNESYGMASTLIRRKSGR